MSVKIIIKNEAFDATGFYESLANDEIGASIEFSGIVRRGEDGESIDGLYYEAYSGLAEAEMTGIIDDLKKQYPVGYVGVYHRLGWVPVGETSLFIQVHSSHRSEGFAFCAEFITKLKQSVPIWKNNEPGKADS